MATLYVGTAAAGYKYTSLQGAINDSSEGDTVIVTSNLDYTSTGGPTHISSLTHSLTIKGEVSNSFNYDAGVTAGSWPIRLYSYYNYAGTINLGLMSGISAGITSPATIIFEDLELHCYNPSATYYDKMFCLDLSSGGPYLNVIFNRCLCSNGIFIYRQLQGVVEIRNSRFLSSSVIYPAVSMGNNAICNFIKTESDRTLSPYGTTATDWTPQIADVRTIASNTVGYGPGYGTEIVSKIAPKIAGYVVEGGSPVSGKAVFLLRRTTGKVVSATTSSISGYYEFDCRFVIGQELAVVVLRNPSDPSSKSVIVDRIIPVDPRA